MNFVPTPLAGAFLIEIDRKEDTRGFFARLWCREEFAAHGITIDIVQASVSHNAVAGTVRGMHFQWPPSREAKLVRCERGRIHDVIVDLRPDATTFYDITTRSRSMPTIAVRCTSPRDLRTASRPWWRTPTSST